ncbi:MAG: thioesterase family protein [SAR324 cluster bacterium]|nr:thioesterase family protein [SAR324 cluster bacterium]MCZ6626978.1 thioesterase family protein [SAR324 cluster bacterium]
MKDSLAVGISNEVTVTTTPEMGVAHLGEGPGVFSTPSMIGLMEKTALESLLPHLEDNEQSVGTMVHIWHRAAVNIGEEVQCRTKLIEQDRRKLVFEVEVTSGDLKVGDGTHERFVIDLNKFKKD